MMRVSLLVGRASQRGFFDLGVGGEGRFCLGRGRLGCGGDGLFG